MGKKLSCLILSAMLLVPSVAHANSGLAGLDVIVYAVMIGFGAFLLVPPLTLIAYHVRCYRRKTPPARGWLLAQVIFSTLSLLAGLLLFFQDAAWIRWCAGAYCLLLLGMLVQAGRGLTR